MASQRENSERPSIGEATKRHNGAIVEDGPADATSLPPSHPVDGSAAAAVAR
jgi:hypothetical protein